MMARILQSDAGQALATLAALAAAVGLWKADRLPRPAAGVMEAAANDGASDLGLDQMTQNYYQAMMDNDDVDNEPLHRGGAAAGIIQRWLTGAEEKKKKDSKNLLTVKAAVPTEKDFISINMLPNVNTFYWGTPFQTNRWGLRDQDCEKTKPPGVFRICMAGGSNTMGNGVLPPGIYADLFEARLNKEFGGRPYQRYEVLNFGMTAYGMLEQLHVARTRMPEFQPDVAMVTVTIYDLGWLVYEHLSQMVEERRDIPYEFLRRIVERAGCRPGDSRRALNRKLKKFREPMLEGCFEELRKIQDASGVPVVVVVLRLNVTGIHGNLRWEARAAESHGLTVVRLFTSYDGRKPEEMYIDPMRDHHPTPFAHGLIADELFGEFTKNPGLLALLEGRPKS